MSKEQDRENENAAPQTQVGIGPGERLQAARIKKGLSLEDVANRMHLSASILEAIEENNFDEITAPIFVKGYLRAYARIVALSEDEMIQQYVDFYSEEDPPISSTSNMVPELSVADARIKWTTYLVILVLGVLLAAWWWNKQQGEAPSISLDAQTPASESAAGAEQPAVDSNIEAGSESGIVVEPQVEPTPAQSSVAASAGAQEINAEAEPEAETPPPQEPAETAAAEPAASSGAAQPIAVASEPEVVDGESEEDSSTGSGAANAMATPAAEAEPSVAEPVSGTRDLPTRVAPSGSDRLEIIVNADTWADVKDANSHQLVYDLLRAGNRVELTGQAPFAVFLGNGYGVELLLNDEEIGITSRIRNDNTARVSIGG